MNEQELQAAATQIRVLLDHSQKKIEQISGGRLSVILVELQPGGHSITPDWEQIEKKLESQ